jgi:UDP-3-O-[3-hydroxymyristoyl] glucosamine N-acyltransferase
VVITGNTAVVRDVPDNSVMMGYPAVTMKQNMAMYRALRRLPRVLARLEGAQKPVFNPDASD